MNDDYIFVMSAAGSLDAQPNGAITGTLVGYTSVEVSSGADVEWVGAGSASAYDLNFTTLANTEPEVVRFHNYTVND